MSQVTALTIGNFDGVHRGHAALVHAARAAVGEDGRVIALSFDPHPATILHPASTPGRLTGFPEREVRLRAAGADRVDMLQPTPELLRQSPEDFMESMMKQYDPRVIVEGPDFRFGRNREGSVDTLQELGESYGYRTVVIDPVKAVLTDGYVVRVSSSLIRRLLGQGRVSDASRLLGRPYSVTGLIVEGDRRGRTIGFPTANLESGEWILPADGIYAGLARRGGEEGIILGVNPGEEVYPAAISIGSKPTFGGSNHTCEAHLLGYNGPVDDYGWTIHLEFHRWLRDQVAFSEVSSLIEQIRRDTERTESLMGATTPA